MVPRHHTATWFVFIRDVELVLKLKLVLFKVLSAEMCEEVLDELAVLSAIFCGKDEFEVMEESAETGLVYRIHTLMQAAEKETPLNLTFHLPPGYPREPLDMSVSSSELSRKQCQELKEVVLNKARSLQAGPMVHELVMWLQQNFSDLIATSDILQSQTTADGKAEGLWVVLLHLDHMRSRAKYIKLIEKWAAELGLTGRLFVGKPILILLQGERRSIKEYIHLQRTAKVDVDSSGKRCKEKMMSVLCEIPVSEDSERIATFEVKETLSSEDLKQEFAEVGSLKLYQEFVPSLL